MNDLKGPIVEQDGALLNAPFVAVYCNTTRSFANDLFKLQDCKTVSLESGNNFCYLCIYIYLWKNLFHWLSVMLYECLIELLNFLRFLICGFFIYSSFPQKHFNDRLNFSGSATTTQHSKPNPLVFRRQAYFSFDRGKTTK